MAFVPSETLIGDHLTGQIVLMEPETATLFGALGMLMLAVSWWMRAHSTVRLAQLGWILVGIYFFSQSWTYLSHAVSYTHLTLPTNREV